MKVKQKAGVGLTKETRFTEYAIALQSNSIMADQLNAGLGYALVKDKADKLALNGK